MLYHAHLAAPTCRRACLPHTTHRRACRAALPPLPPCPPACHLLPSCHLLLPPACLPACLPPRATTLPTCLPPAYHHHHLPHLPAHLPRTCTCSLPALTRLTPLLPAVRQDNWLLVWLSSIYRAQHRDAVCDARTVWTLLPFMMGVLPVCHAAPALPNGSCSPAVVLACSVTTPTTRVAIAAYRRAL